MMVEGCDGAHIPSSQEAERHGEEGTWILKDNFSYPFPLTGPDLNVSN